MNALTKIENTALTAMSEAELIGVLQSSLYPGAKLESIKMVLGYCKASGLDPMKKPVHIVPMKVSTGQKDDKGWDIKESRDVIMPGVGMYRTEASRTGQYAGVSEPEFGPMRELDYSVDKWEDAGGRRHKTTIQKKLTYPEWCRVTVERIVDGQPRQFTAKEYWLENYATKGSDGAPNEMWAKRPMGQLSKCAEAQALRKAFPDTTGAQPTADEMEGHGGDEPKNMGAADVVATPPPPPAPPPAYTAEKFAELLPTWRKAIADKKATAESVIAKAKTKGTLTEEQEAAIREPAAPIKSDAVTDVAPKVTYAALADMLTKAENIDALNDAAALISALPADQQAGANSLYETRKVELS